MNQELEKPMKKNKMANPMRNPKISKVVLSAGAVGPDLDKAVKLLEMLSGMKVQIIKSGPKKRIPAFSVKPNMPLGARVTLRGGKAITLLKRALGAIDNTLKENSVDKNTFSFGIKEYLEIPGIEYQRDLGIMGLDVTVVFKRTGRRTKIRKIKRGKIPKRQKISK